MLGFETAIRFPARHRSHHRCGLNGPTCYDALPSGFPSSSPPTIEPTCSGTRSPVCRISQIDSALGSRRRRQQFARPHSRRSLRLRRTSSPVSLRYVFEREQGRSAGPECGISKHPEAKSSSPQTTMCGSKPDWLEDGVRAGDEAVRLRRRAGGSAWESEPPPGWVPRTNGRDVGGHRAARLRLEQSIQSGSACPARRQHGDAARGHRACRRLRHANRGARRARCSVRKYASGACVRTAAGLVGYYIPKMVVRHLIPSERLNERYLRRWFYWRGISRAMLYAQTGKDMEVARAVTARFFESSPTSPACPDTSSAALRSRGARRHRREASPGSRSTRSNASSGCGCSPASFHNAGKIAPTRRL